MIPRGAEAASEFSEKRVITTALCVTVTGMKRLFSSLVLACVVATGCGGDDGASGEEEDTDVSLEDEPEFDPAAVDDSGVYFRVLLVPDASGGVSIEEIERISVAAEERPRAVAGGDWLLVARSGGAAVDASLVAFPRLTSVEGDIEDYTFSEDIVDEPGPIVAYVLDDGTDRIELLAADGSVAAAVDAADVPPLGFRNGSLLPGRYRHIKLLGAGDEGLLPKAFTTPNGPFRAQVADATVAQRDEILSILDGLAPAATLGVSQIALVRLANSGCRAASAACAPPGEVRIARGCENNAAVDADGAPRTTGRTQGAATGSSLVLNVEGNWQASLRHEITHVGNNLLNAQAAVPAAGWDDLDVAAARRTAEKNALGKGLSQAWFDLHNGIVANGEVASFVPYPSVAGEDPNWCALSEDEALARSHVRNYGSKSVAEDIATYAEELMSKGGQSPICRQFQNSLDNELTAEMAMAYSKLVLLTNLEFITEEKFNECLGGFNPGITTPGIKLGDQTFTTELRYGFYESDFGIRYFAILGQGVEEWQLLYEVYTPEDRSPVGMHRLGRILFGAITPRNGVYLNHPETPRASQSGYLLITEANEEQVAGAVINLQLENALGQKTTHYLYAPFLIKN